MNLSQRSQYELVKSCAKNPPNLAEVLSQERVELYQIKQEEWVLSYASTQVDAAAMDALQLLSDDVGVISLYQRLLDGEPLNVSENRSITHHHTRDIHQGGIGDDFIRVKTVCENIREHKICSYNQTPFKHVIQIGIGGSCFGPKAIYEALKQEQSNDDKNLSLSFLSSIDPLELEMAINDIEWDSTLFIIASKSGSTQETLMNSEEIIHKAEIQGISRENIQQNMIAITTKGSPLDQQAYLDRFYIDEGVCGRFSVTSSIGTCGLILAVGPKKVSDFLIGAAKMDAASLNPSIRENIALCLALLGIWEQHFLGYQGRFIVPYIYALRFLPEHIKQVWCESLGKRYDSDGNCLQINTSPIISGGIGTDSQHATFQHAHQGQPIVPIHFIAQKNQQESGSHQDVLNINMISQIVALAEGAESQEEKKPFPGNRPSSLLLTTQLTAEALGQLISVYENMIMFQSFILGINAFDQPGVELGKSLTKKILSKSYNKKSVLYSFLDLIH